MTKSQFFLDIVMRINYSILNRCFLLYLKHNNHSNINSALETCSIETGTPQVNPHHCNDDLLARPSVLFPSHTHWALYYMNSCGLLTNKHEVRMQPFATLQVFLWKVRGYLEKKSTISIIEGLL